MDSIHGSTAAATTMKAAICTAYGPPDVVKIEDRPIPVPKDDEVLIHVHAATVSSGDCRVRGLNIPALYKPIMALIYGVGKPRQAILGTELSGQVESVGKDVTTYRVGDSVFAMTGMKMGAHAEYIVLPENGKLMPKPNNISYEQAAAIAFGGTSALHFFRKADLKKGQRILIYGASGAVGTSAVQLAKHLGAEVTGVCSQRNLELVKSLGAAHVIDYTTKDFRSEGQQYDVIFDAVGKITKASCKHVLATNGKYITVSGGPASERLEDLQLLGDLADSGNYIPVIDKIYPLAQIVDAYTYVETGRKRGSVVITFQ